MALLRVREVAVCVWLCVPVYNPQTQGTPSPWKRVHLNLSTIRPGQPARTQVSLRGAALIYDSYTLSLSTWVTPLSPAPGLHLYFSPLRRSVSSIKLGEGREGRWALAHLILR